MTEVKKDVTMALEPRTGNPQWQINQSQDLPAFINAKASTLQATGNNNEILNLPGVTAYKLIPMPPVGVGRSAGAGAGLQTVQWAAQCRYINTGSVPVTVQPYRANGTTTAGSPVQVQANYFVEFSYIGGIVDRWRVGTAAALT